MKNNVEYITHMGNDKLHSLAAWASTFYDLELKLPDDPRMRVDEIVDYIISKSKRMRSIENLLKYLADNKHESPFRMSSFVFGMTTDIATHIQKLKHAVLLEAENGESAKYKELKEDKFYLPADWIGIESRDTYIFSSDGISEGDDCNTWYETLEDFSKMGNELYHQALLELTPILGGKRAKETCRYFKTYNSQINTVNKFSFAGIMAFYDKRTVSFAQEEIKQVAKDMVECIKNIPDNPFEFSLKAFNL